MHDWFDVHAVRVHDGVDAWLRDGAVRLDACALAVRWQLCGFLRRRALRILL